MTPAILLVRARGIAHEVLSYAHDPAVASYGKEAVDALGLDAATVFKIKSNEPFKESIVAGSVDKAKW